MGVLWSLREFLGKAQAERVDLSVVAWSLPLEEEIALRRQFLAMDSDDDGVLKLDELRAFLEAMQTENIATREDILSSLDGNRGGEVSYSEFLAAISSLF